MTILAHLFAIALYVGFGFAALCLLDKLIRGKFWKRSNRKRCAESMARWKIS